VRRAATVRAEPLLVQPRWLLHAGFLALMLAVVVVLIIVRRGDLDFEEELGSAGLLVLCCWLFALGAGSLVRSVRAGHALKLDALGVHIPGADVIPWSAVASADLGADGGETKRLRQMVLHTEGLSPVPALQAYERYVFGPLAGLKAYQGRVVVAVGLLAIDVDELLAAAREHIEVAGTLASARRDVATSATGRAAAGRHLP
jgi:hypothetical protein